MGPLLRRRWPWALAVLFVALLVWYLVYTERIVRALRADAATLTEIYSEVQGALADPVESLKPAFPGPVSLSP